MKIELMTTGLTTNRMTTDALTNCPHGADFTLQGQPCATDAVVTALNAPAAIAAPEPKIDPSSELEVDLGPDPNSDSWRIELAARLARYRTRRKPRTPRYPSLLLPFDLAESWSRPATSDGSNGENVFIDRNRDDNSRESAAASAVGLAHQTPEPDTSEQATYRYPDQTPESPAKVIEFPRSAAIPIFHSSDLADPVFDHDRPRIVEAPEILPPPPALGGMLMEPARQEPNDRRADSPCATPSASIARRALATLVDGAMQAAALATFAAIFLRLNHSLNQSMNSSLNFKLSLLRGPLPIFAGTLGAIAVLLWMAYEFFFVVYTGSTPGLRAAGLQLAGFDGSPVSRRSRRWRVLASFLSAFSAGLGYLWCFLDQDGLCWHDRITHTHVQCAAQAE